MTTMTVNPSYGSALLDFEVDDADFSNFVTDIALDVFSDLDISIYSDGDLALGELKGEFNDFRYEVLEPKLLEAIEDAITDTINKFPMHGNDYKDDLGHLL